MWRSSDCIESGAEGGLLNQGQVSPKLVELGATCLRQIGKGLNIERVSCVFGNV